MSVMPYVVGQWVRGEKFYGRSALIEEILHGNRNWLWLLGTRRIGKTSLLRQLELLALAEPTPRFFPLFWDFQGAEDSAELHGGFGDAVLDAEERLDALRIDLAELRGDDLFRSLALLRRRLHSKGLVLLLLCDEVEELIKLNEREPSLLRKLRRALQSPEDVRSVLASTIRLWALADERGDTSPFVHGFTPPLYIHNLADDEARALIHQANLPSESRPRIDEPSVEIIRQRCDNHPFLIQLLCKRYLELGDLEQAAEQVATDPMVSFFFSVDFEMLSETERDVLRIVAEQDSATSGSIQERLALDASSLGGGLHRLEHLGYLRRNREGRFGLVNDFFARWFREAPRGRRPPDAEARPTVAAEERTTASAEVTLGLFDGRYRLLERVGEGATGVVYRSHDDLLRSDIAIKVLKREYAAHEEAVERLRREVLLARGIGHPNVVQIYHLGEFEGRKYLTMQWVAGPTLAQRIARDGPFSAARAARIGAKLAAALEAAHACKVLHRDVKPHNVLVDAEDEPHLSDFGLARLLGETGTTSHGIFLGTPDYASPEQARLDGVDERSDLYALGVVLFEMATGRRPFAGRTTREVLDHHLRTPPPSPAALRPGLPRPLCDVILRCLEKEPARRYASASELRAALERL